MTRNLERAMALKDVYRFKRALGDVVACREIRRTVEELVGEWHDGKFGVPAVVAQWLT